MSVDVVEPSEVSQIKAGNSDKAEKDAQETPAEELAKEHSPTPATKAENAAPANPKAEAKPSEPSPKSAGAPPPPKHKTKTAAKPPATPPLPKPRPIHRQARPQKPEQTKPAPRKTEFRKRETSRLAREDMDEPDEAPLRKPWKKIEPRLPSEGDQYEEDQPDYQPPHRRRLAGRDDEPPVRSREYDEEHEDENRAEAEDARDAEEPVREPHRSRSTMNAAKSKFDSHRIAALLDRREPSAGAERLRQKAPRPQKPWRRPSSFQDQASSMTSATGAPGHERPSQNRRPHTFAERQGSPDGDGDRLSANEIDAFRAQVSRCWTPPVGGLGADAIIVKLHILLKEDGTLARPPRIQNRINSPFFTPAADSALRAVLQCEPYRMPPEKYSLWRDMLLTFDPRQMYGG
jgi:colicin import membrane protein